MLTAKKIIGWHKILLQTQRPILVLSSTGSMSILPLFAAPI